MAVPAGSVEGDAAPVDSTGTLGAQRSGWGVGALPGSVAREGGAGVAPGGEAATVSRRRRHNTDPMRVATNAHLRGGSASIFAGFKSHWWVLVLSCGHEVERNVRWLAPADGSKPRRGYAAQWHGPSLDRLPEPPKQARCEFCGRAERMERGTP